MNTFLLHCYFEWNVSFTYANNLGVLDFLVCASVNWQSPIAFFIQHDELRRVGSSRIEYKSFDSLFSHSYKCSVHSKFEIKIYFSPQRRSSKNETNLYSSTRSDYGFRCACVLKSTNTQLVHDTSYSKAQQSQSLRCRTQISFTIRLKMCLFRVKKSMHLVYRVISCDRSLALRIVRWLPPYPKFVSHAVPWKCQAFH